MKKSVTMARPPPDGSNSTPVDNGELQTAMGALRGARLALATRQERLDSVTSATSSAQSSARGLMHSARELTAKKEAEARALGLSVGANGNSADAGSSKVTWCDFLCCCCDDGSESDEDYETPPSTNGGTHAREDDDEDLEYD